MGRLVLNVLLSFAQFEREIISERTRDKIGAARRKGRWSGGMPLLGYDVVPGKLVVNEDEARRVRAIFQLYAEHQALMPVVHELVRRGWTNKRWTTRKGRERGGRPFDRTCLYNLLTNVAYAGKVRHKQAVFPGQHAAIVDEALWLRVQTTLQRNGRSGGTGVRNRFGALLKGLLHCTACGCAMSPTHCKNGTKRYRYYTCTSASKKGWQTCPAKSIPAGAIEEFVVAQIQRVCQDPAVLAEVIAAANQQVQDRLAELETEQRILGRDLAHWHAEVRATAGTGADGPAAARLADLQERIRLAEQRATAIREEATTLGGQVLDERTAAAALAAFTPVWAALTPPEQARLLHLLLERIDYDAAGGQVVLTFQPTGIQTLTEHQHQEQRA